MESYEQQLTKEDARIMTAGAALLVLAGMGVSMGVSLAEQRSKEGEKNEHAAIEAMQNDIKLSIQKGSSPEEAAQHWMSEQGSKFTHYMDSHSSGPTPSQAEVEGLIHGYFRQVAGGSQTETAQAAHSPSQTETGR